MDHILIGAFFLALLIGLVVLVAVMFKRNAGAILSALDGPDQ